MTSPMGIQLFNDIMSECNRDYRKRRIGLCYLTDPTFSDNVRHRLEQYERNARKEIVSRKEQNCAPLYHACEMGHAKMVEYLISVCGADVDQTGQPYNQNLEKSETPLQRACYSARNCHFEIVRCLVKNGADIHRADASGRTCLMRAVPNVQVCQFLLANGADVNARDRKNKTALHYAIRFRRLDAVKLLLDYGADVTLWSSLYYDDALQTACLEGHQPIFDYLVEHGSYSPGRLADANELMGSSRWHDRETGLQYWRKAIEIRNSNAVDGKPLAKTASMPKRDCYHIPSEFTTLDELDAIALDPDALQIQKLLIYERLLGLHRRATFDVLKCIGASYIKSFRYKTCFDLWRRALEISTANNSIFSGRVYNVAKDLVRVMLHCLHERTLEVADPNRVNEEQLRFADVVAIFKLLTNRLVTAPPPSKELLAMHEEKGDGYAILKCVIPLIDLLLKTARTSEDADEVRALVRHLVNRNPMSTETHDTLLHLCVSKIFLWKFDVPIFPNPEVTKLLLECEADVNARNEDGKTPLHIAIYFQNVNNQIVKLLLDHGAHLDTPDLRGSIPGHEIVVRRYKTVDLMKYTTLRCLAARAIVKYKIQYNDLPTSVNQFLDLHRLYKSKPKY